MGVVRSHKGRVGTRWLLALLLWMCAPLTCHAITPIDVLSMADSQSVSASIEYLEDPQRILTLSDVQGEYANRFIPGTEQTLNKGYTQSAFWLHLQLQNSAQSLATSRRVVVQLDYPMLDDIEFYIVNQDVAEGYWHTGDLFPASSRPIDHGTFVFPLAMEPDTVKDIYLRIQGSSSMRMPVMLWDELAFHKAQRTSALIHGLFYGILLLMAFYNLCLFISVRDLNYLLYVGYTLSISLLQSTMIGDAPVYLWGEYPFLNEHLVPTSIALTAAFIIFFSHRVLDLTTITPRISRFVKMLGYAQLILIVMSILLPYGIMIRVTSVDALIVCTSIICIAVYAALLKDRSAIYFLFAWLMLLAGAIVLALVSLGVLPANAFTVNAFYVGNTIEVTLLSLSLAERMRRSLQAKVKAEQRANEALVDVNLALQESNTLKDEFLATISHELRTPMNGVMGSIDQLKHPNDAENQQRLVRCADQSAQDLMSLLDSVLTYTELASGKLIIENRPFSIARMVKEAEAAYAPLCKQKGLAFSVVCVENLPPLLGDARRIQQVIYTLLDNAVKFTARGSVELLVRRLPTDQPSHETVLFSVIDSGIGIAENARSHIFEKFRQADGAFNRGHGGLGIGLAICKELTTALQGEIDFDSVENEGSVFNVRLTLAHAPAEHVEVITVNGVADKRKPTVMVVEDNPTNQLVLKGILKKLGVDVLTANNGEEALQILGNENIDTILMDCQMPIMDGFAATEAIRQMSAPHSSIPIIAVTANAMAQDKERCLAVGMNDYMSKPVNTGLLKEKLIYWLARSPSPKQLAA